MGKEFENYVSLRQCKETIEDEKYKLLEMKEEYLPKRQEIYQKIENEKTAFNEYRLSEKSKREKLKEKFRDKSNHLTLAQYKSDLEKLNLEIQKNISIRESQTNKTIDSLKKEYKKIATDLKEEKRKIWKLKVEFKKTVKLEYPKIKKNTERAKGKLDQVILENKPIITKLKKDSKFEINEIKEKYNQLLKNESSKDKKEKINFEKFDKLNEARIKFSKSKEPYQKQINDAKANYRLAQGKSEKFDFNLAIDKVNMGAGKIANSRYISAIRGGFFQLMPFILIGAFWLLLLNVVLSYNEGGLIYLINPSISDQAKEVIDRFKDIGLHVYNGSFMLFGLLLCFTTSYHLAKWYKMESPSIPAVLSTATLVILMPTDFAQISNFTSTNSSFMAMLTACFTTEIYRKLTSINKLKIKMPASVPSGVAKPFNVLIPIFISTAAAGIVAVTVFLIGKEVGEITIGSDTYTITTIDDLIKAILQAPLQNFTQGLGGLLMILFVWQLLWFVGIQSSSIISPIVEPIWLNALNENAQGAQNIVTKPFWDGFIFQGGGGATIALIIAIFIFSKRSDWKAMAAVALIPGIFNINEPLIFGLPIMLNPVIMIPFIFVPLILGTVAYLATAWGLVGVTFVMAPWTTPSFIGSYLATGGDWKAPVLSIVNIAIAIGGYTPFVFLGNFQSKRDMVKNAVKNQESKRLVLNN